jgi:hypothetical protein
MFEDRLGFLSGQNVLMSETSAYFNFFATTVMTTLDSDPVDAGATDNAVTSLYFAHPVGQKVLLFSEFGQYTLSAGSASGVTPRTAKIRPTTEYEVNIHARPIHAGRMVYFAGPKGESSAVREYFVSPDEVETKEAPDITEHVPTYIPANMVQLESAVNSPFILARTSDDLTKMFVYNYFWRGNDKVQSAWHTWTFSGEVLGMQFFDDELYLVVKYTDGIYLEKMSIAVGVVDTGLDYVCHLDRRIDDSACTSITYNASNDETTFNLPYDIDGGTDWVVVTRYDAGGGPDGQLLSIVSANSTSIVVSGDHRTTKVYIGKSYTSRYRFSRQFVKEDREGGEVAVTDANLIITFFELQFENTGSFTLRVTPEIGVSHDKEFTGRVVGLGSNVIGQVALATGSTRFLVGGRNTMTDVEILADSFMPAHFQSASWQGRFYLKSSRIGGA